MCPPDIDNGRAKTFYWILFLEQKTNIFWNIPFEIFATSIYFPNQWEYLLSNENIVIIILLHKPFNSQINIAIY